jgi:hypothetical protein
VDQFHGVSVTQGASLLPGLLNENESPVRGGLFSMDKTARRASIEQNRCKLIGPLCASRFAGVSEWMGAIRQKNFVGDVDGTHTRRVGVAQ